MKEGHRMILFMKHIKGIVIFAGLIILTWILFRGGTWFLRLDLSRDYQQIEGVESIVFQRNGWNESFRRSFWGLQRLDPPKEGTPDGTHESDSSLRKLINFIDTDNVIRQSIFSPNQNYILYCEVEYDYKHTTITDDEYCYYRVYNVETDEIITIYQAYRQWYNLSWNN